MTVLLDTNVLLDVLLARPPFAAESAKVYDACDRGELTGFLCASAVTDLFYIIRKATKDRGRARALIEDICQGLAIAPVNRSVIVEALGSTQEDFEDAVAAAAGRAVNVDAIVTLDPAGFRGASLPVHSPREIVEMWGL
ncbi:PIN domain-containing protein [soil metagenome]